MVDETDDVVLHTLEPADRNAELDPALRIGDRLLVDGLAAAHYVGAQERQRSLERAVEGGPSPLRPTEERGRRHLDVVEGDLALPRDEAGKPACGHAPGSRIDVKQAHVGRTVASPDRDDQ